MMRFKKIISGVFATVFIFNAVYAVSDVKDMPTGWSEGAVNSAVENKILVSEDGYIRPTDLLTRAEMALGINNIFGTVDKADLSEYTDVPKYKWYYDEMAKAVAMGLFSGYGNGLLKPEKNITRQEMFSAIYNALDLAKGEMPYLEKFIDKESISDWARDIVARMAQDKYVSGNLEGKIKPLDPITREEFAQIMKNIFALYCNKTGIYTDFPEGNIVVNTPGVTLRNGVINGDLIITEGVGSGSIVLDNVVVKGRVYARSGENIQLINKSKIEGELVINNLKATTNITSNDSEIANVSLRTNANIEGSYKNVNVKGKITLKVKGNLDLITVDEISTIDVSKSKIDKVIVNSNANDTKISGNGTINTVEANADNVEVSTDGTKVTAGMTSVGVKAGTKDVLPGETVVVKTSSGGGGGGGGSSGGTTSPSNCKHNWKVTSEATCEVGKIETCSRCKSTQEVEPALGHIWEEKVPATCTSGRVDICTRCGDTQVGATIPHTYVETTAATCTTGNIEVCSECSGVSVGKPLGHAYDENEVCARCKRSKKGDCVHEFKTILPATCTTYEILQCSICNEIQKGEDAKEHEWEVFIEASCETNQVDRCRLCERTKYGEKTAFGHDWETIVEPTCTVAEKQRCNNCKGVRELSALGHDWSETPETCTTDGYRVCQRENCKLREEREGALGHDWGETVAATCAKGSYHKCKRLGCGVEEKLSDSLPHDWKIVEATCTTGSYKECKREGCKAKEKLSDPLPHDWKIVEATCTTGSYKECKREGCKEKEDLSGELGHSWEYSLEPTCTQKGIRYCTACNIEPEEVDPLDHNWVPKTAATCKEPAVEKCNREGCDEERQVGTTIDHNYVVTTVATCEVKEVKTCTMCEAEIEGKALGHEYFTVEPTCTQAGITVCSRCKESTTLSANGHSWGDTVEATCTTPSYKECANCKIVEYIGNALGHNYEDGKCSRCDEYAKVCAHTYVVTTPATCETAAIETCSKCQATRNSEDGSIGHNFVKYIDATCTTAQVDKCENCDKLITNEENKATGHNLQTTAPTCINAGYTECLNCHEITNVKDALGHDIGEDGICKNCEKSIEDICSHAEYTTKTPATCTMAEIKACTVCGHEIIVGEPKGHIYSVTKVATCTSLGEETCKVCFVTRDYGELSEHDWVVTSPATCETVAIKTCSKCFERQEGDKLEHAWESIDATCTEAAYEVCSKCGMKKEFEGSSALGHDWVTVNATCTEDGSKTCSRCSESETIDALDHDFIIKKQTCTEDGSKTCSRCDYFVKLDKYNHSDTSTEEATCSKEGLVVCNLCGEIIETLSKLEHQWSKIDDATCTTAEKQKCDLCEATQYVGEAKGHSYNASGTCTKCGESLSVNCEHNYKQTTAATCTTLAIQTCTKCGAMQEAGEALGHSWKTTKKATCTTAAIQTCQNKGCGKTQTIDQFADHSWKEKAATCLESGYTKCSVCGEMKDIKEPLGHNYSEGVCTRCKASSEDACEHIYQVITEATCTAAGKEKCTICGLEREIMPNVHTYVYQVGTATCTVYGKEKCSVCNLTRDTDKLLEHSWIDIASATCSSSAKQKCSNCGATRSNGTTLSHTWGFEVDATCISAGIHSCTVCGITEVNPEAPAKGHDYENGTVLEKATCTTDGTIQCANCTTTETLPKTGHNFGSANQIIKEQPDCTNYGIEQCANAGCTETQTMDPLGHENTENIREATCTIYAKWYCGRCKSEWTDTSKLGHDWVRESDSTCSKKAVYKCSKCQATKDGDEKLKSHKMVTTPGTCLKPERYECSVCGLIEREGNYGDHTWSTISELTCTTAEVKKCTECEREETVKEAPGHKFDIGICTECGEPEVCIITFNAVTNGGTLIGNETVEVSNGSSITGDLPTAEKEGYTFDGWFTEATGGEEFDEETILTNHLTLYAQFTETLGEPAQNEE